MTSTFLDVAQFTPEPFSNCLVPKMKLASIGEEPYGGPGLYQALVFTSCVSMSTKLNRMYGKPAKYWTTVTRFCVTVLLAPAGVIVAASAEFSGAIASASNTPPNADS